ncbi:low-complexity protein [Thiocapsa sp.]|uniref:HvfA family oxazolone/thioamide-modified RiPP metallophore n=1 Tax=Thiocapsa sp. TaxID=2024551 RepID=UPI002C968F73|nr:low-complexity protein [Thiocapsa sp.]HSO83160.1 low-complexity protein [Thiocapsa sp.]
MTKKTITPAAALVGAALVGSLGAFGLAQAADNPFSAQSLDAGYMQLAGADTEGKCGEGKCGGAKDAEGKCGEAKCGADKGTEGKCGEGKCGADKGKDGTSGSAT